MEEPEEVSDYGTGGVRGNDRRRGKETRQKQSARTRLEIEELKERVQLPLDPSAMGLFADYPISKKTCKGLKACSFLEPTEIQRESLLFSLQGLDILGAAKTGSGKTLAFIIPILENLYRSQWGKLDGLGALVVTPVRELAYQIFEVLHKVGQNHDFSAGLLIGGRGVQFEKRRLERCNVIICTPGRLLQHMDENPFFDATNLKIFVLDEADRILDMGFKTALNAIIENLPCERQTMLFSATQTKSVKDLARLSLRNPVYVSVHEHSKHSTPESLKQSYVVCELHQKIGLLWSFVKYHVKQKMIIFMASCKQVKFISKIFSRLRPSLNVMMLHGGMRQVVRTSIYDEFCSESSAVLIATDIAARGLDFPSVNWVIQADCPENANEYIHRVGRTARYEKNGESLLILLPSEEETLVAELTAKKIPITKIKINPKNQLSIQFKLECILARDTELKTCAQGAFVAYLKSVFLMKNKKIFDVTKLDTEAYARSFGLAIAPRVRFLQKQGVVLNRSNGKEKLDDSFDDKLEFDSRNVTKQRSKPYAEESYRFDLDIYDDEEVFTVRQRIEPDDEIEEVPPNPTSLKSKKAITREDIAKKIIKKNIKANSRLVFDDYGNVVEDQLKQQSSELAKAIKDDCEGGIDIQKAKLIMCEEDKIDKTAYRQKVKHKRWAKQREEKDSESGGDSEEDEDEDEDEDENEYEGGEGSDEVDVESVDLDFLPDPDKVYGKRSFRKGVNQLRADDVEYDPWALFKKRKKEDEGLDVTMNDSLETTTKKSLKTTIKESLLTTNRESLETITENSSDIPTKTPRSWKFGDDGLDTGLELADDEKLALHLLNM